MEKSSSTDYEFRTISVKDLLNMEIAPVKWLVQNLIPEGLTIVAGPPKIGKSFLCWNIAIAVASGGIALSHFDVENKYSVLYAALEDSYILLQDRLKIILKEESPPGSLIITDQLPVFDMIGLHSLRDYLIKTEVELLIIDTLKHIKPPGGGSNAYDEDYQSLIPIQQLATDMNIGIILVTHTRKSKDYENPFNEIQGSVGIQAGCDTIIMISKSNESDEISMHVIGRRIPETEYAINLKDGIWQVSGSMQDIRSQSTADKIKELLQENPTGMTPIQISNALGIGEPTIRSSLKRLREKYEVKTDGKRKYTLVKDTLTF